MKNKKYLFSISLLISLLIILIPVAIAKEIKTYDNSVLKTSEQRINLYQSLGDSNLNDPGQACAEQHKQTSSFADVLDNSIISTLEKIASVLFAICTVMSTIDTVISTISLIIGMWSGPCCIPDPTSPGRCTAAEAKFRTWSAVYAFVQPLCCFVNCGWCTGSVGCFSIFGIDLGSISLGAIPDLDIAGPGSGIAQFKLSPYDSIYTAIGCLCPIAILFNLRKLKTIYEVYDCCVQEACENGLSTEACEKQLDEATCMFWEGSLYSILAKILMAIIGNIIIGVIAKVFGLKQLLACVYAVLKIAEVPKVIQLAKSAWSYMGKTFNKPLCEDLGFDEIKEASEAAMREAAEKGFEDVEESLLENWEYITLIDKDDDRIYDYHAPEWKKTAIVGEYETTIKYWDYDEKSYVEKIYWKKSDETIEDYETGEEVSWWKWQKIKGRNFIKKDKTDKEIAFNRAYEVTWELLDLTLGETVDNYVKDQCKSDSEKSYPPSDEPTDSGGEETICEGINYNIYNAQFISKTQLNNACKYQVSYSIKTCGASINYIIILAGNVNEEVIETGNIGLGQTISQNRIITSGLCTHETICIRADDNHNQCYPPLNPGGWSP